MVRASTRLRRQGRHRVTDVFSRLQIFILVGNGMTVGIAAPNAPLAPQVGHPTPRNTMLLDVATARYSVSKICGI
jgi:hypothetical protein